MSEHQLNSLRKELDRINLELLALMNERAKIVKEIGEMKTRQGVMKYDPVRERKMLDDLVRHNEGPFEDGSVRHLFKEIFKASLNLQGEEEKKALLVSRKRKSHDTVVTVGNNTIGEPNKQVIAGPCSVESKEQVRQVAASLAQQGVSFLRGGAFKPRTSPYDFQGLGEEGLRILREVADEFKLNVVSEIVNPGDIEMATKYVDMIQIGARNMQNFDLLKEAGKVNTPVFLKRGMAATIEELLFAAEYIVSRGNEQVILCERGIRTYEKWTRNTLDISAVPILKQESHLPVIVDITHSTGRRDILLPVARAALAAGADGIMVEVHPDPSVALSDANQQIDIPTFEHFISELL
ncbi:bifunctional 3-deoxy-7-phosphoheptulonate synthase/chorismate mutase [Mechercharimyces sp. CAU 1602]|uniref:bifunctional 3-deoxy-7-phosphoheptulonate synthase/chorismate mutase n=1 Tax=Mechercharimyces sp. CAU 1602 TaxID=2973933 RepID=UPI002162141F|nr:bifunctional 3-deoxy-7-phosphoheptulonate synthase/chorismate mutase [Mechercharimyces sp. CAU 1602]MCS1350110.1 bifunctional 3-deoxy-7-phosphoheptulonate synthase/chorismate mutase [Mechercharimyces sp. CAU 1602]